MKGSLSFHIPFSGFAAATFINCFTSAYMFLEGIETPGSMEYACALRETGRCSGCGNCKKTPVAMQERYFFLFDTVCGRSSLRCRFDGVPTEAQKRVCETDFCDGGAEENVDFLFGYAGYAYHKLTDAASFYAAIVDSIGAGRPVIAKVAGGKGRFRLIVGYDGEKLLQPDYANAQEKPEGTEGCADFEALYVVGEKGAPRYSFRDGLRRAIGIMEANAAENLWGGYTEKMGLYTADSLSKATPEEKKARMGRVAQTMWDTFNSHNFAEVFRDRLAPELRAARYDELCQRIGRRYGYTHDLAWALIGLDECADWSKHAAGYFGEMVELTLSQIESNDADVLEALKRLVDMLGE